MLAEASKCELVWKKNVNCLTKHAADVCELGAEIYIFHRRAAAVGAVNEHAKCDAAGWLFSGGIHSANALDCEPRCSANPEHDNFWESFGTLLKFPLHE